MLWIPLHPAATPDMLGYIPTFLHESDPRPAAQQIAAHYVGGWDPFPGFKLGERQQLIYPGDPPMSPLFMSTLREETIFFYDHAWLRIVQPDDTWEVSRLD